MATTLTSSGVTFNDGSSQNNPGIAANLSISAPSRSAGTTYTNSNSYPILVSAVISANVGGAGFTITVGGVNISSTGTIHSYSEMFTFPVPAGATYNISGSVSVLNWFEYA